MLSFLSVPRPGIEPGWILLVFETSASTNSAIWALASTSLAFAFAKVWRKFHSCKFFMENLLKILFCFGFPQKGANFAHRKCASVVQRIEWKFPKL